MLNKIEYSEGLRNYVFKPSKIKKVIFIQGIQGSGKSTIADNLENAYKVEQDFCYGCTKTCQFQLFYHLKKGRNVVVSRCNAEPKQYNQFVKIAQSLGAKIYFITPEQAESELYLSISLSGVINRSNEGDKVMVGRYEYPFSEAVDFTTKNWRNFKPVSNSIKVRLFEFDYQLQELAKIALKSGRIENFVMENQESLMRLRRCLPDIVADHQEIIDQDFSGHQMSKSLKQILYVSLEVIDNRELVEIAKNATDWKNVDEIVCSHVTQVFNPGNFRNFVPLSEGDICNAYVDALVRRTADGAMAFRLCKILKDDHEIFVQTKRPHITAVLSNGSKAGDSNAFVFETSNVDVLPLELKVECVCRWNMKFK